MDITFRLISSNIHDILNRRGKAKSPPPRVDYLINVLLFFCHSIKNITIYKTTIPAKDIQNSLTVINDLPSGGRPNLGYTNDRFLLIRLHRTATIFGLLINE